MLALKYCLDVCPAFESQRMHPGITHDCTSSILFKIIYKEQRKQIMLITNFTHTHVIKTNFK